MSSTHDAIRMDIRRAKASKAKAEYRRAQTLNAPLTPPPANDIVRRLQRDAAKQRQLASVAVDRKLRKQFEVSAQLLDNQAQQARQDQLEAHWRAHSDMETATLAQARGDTLDEAETNVPDWVVDEHGAIAKDDKGLPVLRNVRAVARRRKPGLEHCLENRDITQEQYETGIWYGTMCADAAVAGIAGREEIGLPSSPACKASVGPAQWKLDAIEELKRADVAIQQRMSPERGLAVVRLLVAVCYEGKTPRAHIGGERSTGDRAARVLGMALSVLRHHRLIRQAELMKKAKERAKDPGNEP